MENDKLAKLLRQGGPDPGECALRHVARASRAVTAAFDRALKPRGLTGRQFNLLMTLARQGEHNVKRLATELGTDPTTIPRAIRPLEQKGLIEARPGESRRERMLSITPAGRQILADAYPSWRALQASILEEIGDAGWQETSRRLDRLRSAVADADKTGS